MSHPEAVFYDAGGARHHLAVGWAWEVVTTYPHRIEHRGLIGDAPPRIHVVADVERVHSEP